MNKWKLRIQSLRIEEIIFLVFLIPSILITLRANWYFYMSSTESSVKIEGGIWRIIVTLLLMIWFYWYLWFKPEKRVFKFIRNVAPFIFAIAIYTNLHDTIHFVNPNDIHFQLNAIDEWMFGVSPTVWAEKFYHPALTDWLSFAYMNYFWITVILVMFMYYKNEDRQFRTVMLTMMLCYYGGYMLYILFPAAPPRLALADLYSINIFKGTSLITDSARKVVNISASSARGAFPSLHCTITFLTLGMAWRFHKVLFWIFLPIGISLIIATVYLRHHYIIDIYAGLFLCMAVWWVTPRIDTWWRSYQQKRGIVSNSPPVLGVREKI
ncbi:MAG: phosphatase PAP2 family protein [Candidatus Marinimicrobia bacterium]|nr:phosphatase PAP2 family protein [Candidatus Neomarinimicrobiota bacterium]MCF7850589.1 phosphatase PAP2 family protein [Candidatus Neomarinimicrobiota bacterium]MCF7903677.1 phosphatase PAP2 family protein [Candidatus Neomarinimicrobiota bacterium]